MNNFLKGIIGASIALTLAGGAQAAVQENASTTAQDQTMDNTKATTTKAKKSKAKKSKSSTSTGSSSAGQTGTSDSMSTNNNNTSGNGSAEGAGTMNGVGKTSADTPSPQTTNGK